MYHCPKCKTGFELGTKFCQSCGYDLANEFLLEPVCPICNREFPSGTKFCDTDGSQLVTKDKLIPKCVKCGKAYPDTVKFCPEDGGTIIAEARRTSIPKQGSSNPTTTGTTQQVVFSNPSELEKTINLQFIWFAWLLWIGFATLALGGLVIVLPAMILALMLQHRAWSMIQAVSPRTTPGKAIGFQFIPFFCFYWYFIAYYGLSQDINKFIEINRLSIPKMSENIGLSGSIAPIIMVFLGIIFNVFFVSISSEAPLILFFVSPYIIYGVFVPVFFLFTKALKDVLIGIVRNS